MTGTRKTMRPSVPIGWTTCCDRKETTVQSKGSCLQALTAQMCYNRNITQKYKQEPWPPPEKKIKSIYVISLIRTKTLTNYTHTQRHSGSISSYTTTSMERVKWNQVLWALIWLTEVWVPHTSLTVSCIPTKHQRTNSKRLLMYWSMLLDPVIA